MKEFIIGIDFGGTHLRIGAVDRAGNVHYFEKHASAEVCGVDGSSQRLIALIRDYLSRNALASRFSALAIGFPSTVSRDKRIVYSSPNLPLGGEGGLDGQDVVSLLEDALEAPVFLDKDTIFLLQYDLVRQNLKDKGCTIGIYYGTGIGNAVFLNGKFLTGKHGVACELGHIPYFGSENICGCGSRGCAETHAAGYVLRNLWRKHYSEEPFAELFLRHSGEERIKRFVEAMAIPLATELNLFDPDQVILGGGVLEMAGFPMEWLRGYLREFVRKPFPGEDFALLRASSAPEVGVIGAAYYAMERLPDFSADMEDRISMNRFSIIGAAHLDALVEGIEAGERLQGSTPAERIRLGFGGDALNEAVTLARLGGEVDLVSKIGDDSAGDMVLEHCRANGLPLEHIAREADLSTSMNIVLIDRAGERRFITDPHSSLRALSLADVLPWVDALSPVVCFASLFVFPRFGSAELSTLFSAIKQKGSLLATDMTKRKNGERIRDLAPVWPHLDILFANAEEAGLLAGGETVADMAREFLEAGVGCVVIKTGARGCYVASDGFTGIVPGCVSRACVDTTGAGDNFAAAFLFARAAGKSNEDCARFANAVASICVEHLGATTHEITLTEALARVRENYGAEYSMI